MHTELIAELNTERRLASALMRSLPDEMRRDTAWVVSLSDRIRRSMRYAGRSTAPAQDIRMMIQNLRHATGKVFNLRMESFQQ